MYFIITLLLSVWAFVLAFQLSYGIWDSILLVCWIYWPLYLVSILIYAKHSSGLAGLWKLQSVGDFLLVGALLPLVIGVAYFNIRLTVDSQDAAVSFGDNLYFVGVFSVIHWLVIGLSVFVSYLCSKYVLKRRKSPA